MASGMTRAERVLEVTAEEALCRLRQRRAWPGVVGVDDLLRFRMIDTAAEGQVALVSSGGSHLQVARDSVEIEDGDRDGRGERAGVAQVDQGVDTRE